MFSLIVFILKCLFWNNGSQLAVCRQLVDRLLSQTRRRLQFNDISAQRRVCDSRRSPLSAVKYDPLKPNSITLAGSKLVADLQRAEIWPII